MADSLDFVYSRPVLAGGTTTPGDGAIISCSADGWVRLILKSGDFVEIFAQAGITYIKGAKIAGVSATASFTPLATNVVVNVVNF